jgi:hypothetical protein
VTRPATPAVVTFALALGLAASGCASTPVVDMPIEEQRWQQSGSNNAFLMRDLTTCQDHAAIPSELVEGEDGSVRVVRHGYDDDEYVRCMESKGWRRDG